MKTSAFIIVAIVIATVLAGLGCTALPLALLCLQILVFLAVFSGIVDWKWVLTLNIWIWTAAPATLFIPALCEKRAWIHSAIHAAVLIAKIFIFANVVGGNAGGSAR
ncbi:MAG: hypothetical protein WAK48_25210 [Candidatus Acidiferrum sp.]|jgi:hypothetical protein